MIPLEESSSQRRTKVMSSFESGMFKINRIKEIAKVELEGKTEQPDIAQWHQVLTDQIEVCKEAIRWLKDKKTDSSTLAKLKELKIELQILEKKVAEQEKIMTNREQLYGTRELKGVSSFEHTLNELTIEHPYLAENFEHLQNILKRHGHVIGEPITYADFCKLKDFYLKVEGSKEEKLTEIAALVKHEIDLVERTFRGKKELLKDLSAHLPELQEQVPFAQWSIESKMHFYVKSQQILHNPFEAPLDFLDFQSHSQEDKTNRAFNALCGLIKTEQTVTKHAKEEFWDGVPLFEKKAHELATTKELKTFLYQVKMEGLRHILSKVEKQAEKEVLVIGGGPGGLIRAFALGFTGHDYRVIEKRSNEIAKRSNVITFGKGDPKDVSILLFLGLISAADRDGKASFGHLKPNLVEIQIGDVEKYFMQILAEIDHTKNISFQTEPLSITKNGEGQAEVKIKHHNGREETIYPSMVVATDGASSPTRAMLGISRVILAKTTQIAYTTFNAIASPSSFHSLMYRVHNFLRGVALAAAVGIYALVFQVSLEKAYGHVAEGGPTAIFRIPEHDFVPGLDLPLSDKGNEAKGKVPAHDYLIRVLREKEQTFIDSYKDKVNTAAFKISKTEQKIKKESNRDKKAKLEQKLESLKLEFEKLKRQQEEVLTQRAQHMHGLLDVVSSLMSKNHSIQQMSVEKNFLVDIFVGKAEQSLVQVGKTPFALRGDASHTTDPYSGYGCKTAIEEILADQFLFSFGHLGGMNETALSCHNWMHQFYQDKMINQGLRERSLYRTGTELLSRYLDRGIREGVLTREEARNFQLIADKAELNHTHGSSSFISFSSSEEQFMKEQGRILTENLKAQWKSQGKTVKGLDASWQHSLTHAEAKKLNAFIKNLIDFPHLVNAKAIEEMTPILSKMAYEEATLAPTISLLIHCLPFMSV
ncbi:FAD-dependent monooxygenase [Candidatus Protochlamydia phocaeensis]|uniref:FAD-dependent monooxygenase n=1 Tax=Candidatus Protochlamydia phocaeensis TaxID=1414722 RepID=UPI00083811C5|nr:FAD-dependent monooxygenase [Candidatus Protochlamydia phocaeensis]